MVTENLSTLKIHRLTEELYFRELEAGRIDETAIYLTPDEDLDLSDYATLEYVDAQLLEKMSTGADWNQNDETAKDYIKNRTHWVETNVMVNILPEQTVETDDDYYYSRLDGLTENLQEGKTYTVVFNGVTYECIAWFNYEGPIIIGNGDIWGGEGLGGDEPFSLLDYGDGDVFLKVTEYGTYTVSVSTIGSVYHQIDRKFLPHLVGATSIVETGEIFNDYVNNIAYGDYSHAEGESTTASGNCSHAEGASTTASDDCAHAEGAQTTASGRFSHAEGYKAKAEGMTSHAEGYYTKATNEAAHAEGCETTASGMYSHTEGYKTIAEGTGAHAEGHEAKAYGEYSHVEGYRASAYGSYSHAEGYDTYVDNEASYAHAEGYKTKAYDKYSHAEGRETYATGEASHAEGWSAIARGARAHAEGSSTNAYRTASHSEGGNTYAVGAYSHAEGSNTEAIGLHSHALGKSVVAYGDSSHVEGTGSGCSTQISGDANSVVYNLTSSYIPSFNVGSVISTPNSYGEIPYQYAIITEIDLTNKTITLSNTLSETRALSTTVFISDDGIAFSDYSHSEGMNNIAAGRSQHVQGEYNIKDPDYQLGQNDVRGKYAHIVGNGESNDARSNAHTLDWNGNAWFSGDVYVGSTSGTNKDGGSKKLATENYVTENYYTKAEVEALIAQAITAAIAASY